MKGTQAREGKVVYCLEKYIFSCLEEAGLGNWEADRIFSPKLW